MLETVSRPLLFNRAERVMKGRGRKPSDSALPIGKSSDSLLAEVLPGVLFVRGIQREFEDLLAVLIFSPVRWV